MWSGLIIIPAEGHEGRGTASNAAVSPCVRGSVRVGVRLSRSYRLIILPSLVVSELPEWRGGVKQSLCGDEGVETWFELFRKPSVCLMNS